MSEPRCLDCGNAFSTGDTHMGSGFCNVCYEKHCTQRFLATQAALDEVTKNACLECLKGIEKCGTWMPTKSLCVDALELIDKAEAIKVIKTIGGLE